MKRSIVESRILEVSAFKSLSLNLVDLQLETIPPEVFELTHIQHLVIGKKNQYIDKAKARKRNKITEIPPEISKLKNLKILELCGNLIEKLPLEISQLKNLKVLDLTDNLLTELPNSIGALNKLYKLHLGNNNFTDFPESIVEIRNLEYLYLDNNQIKKLPSTLLRLRLLRELSLIENPITLPPPEIVFQQDNIAALQNYFEQLEHDETDFLYEMKLLLVGEGRVGKTSIGKALQSDDYILIDEQTTEGIKIKPWIIKKEELERNNDYRLNIWDFGGQEIYHSTHQFFLTKRSLYLLITESRKEDSHDIFYYWLNLIKLLGDQSPVLMILNKCDQPTKELPIEGYKKVFDNIISFQKVSCAATHKETIKSLRAEIKRLIINNDLFPHLGIPLPKAWVAIRGKIEDLEKSGVNYISFQDYLEICTSYGQDEKNALFLSEFFHDLGVFLHFQDDISLKESIFLNHEWVTEGVYNVLDNNQVKENFGVLTSNDLIEIWHGNQYDSKRHELLSLMKNKKFELCFELEYNKYLIPQLLPVDEIGYTLDLQEENLNYEYVYKFMPKGILARLIVKLHKDIYEDKYWRYGVIFKYHEFGVFDRHTLAVVKEDYFHRKITIQIQGPQKKSLLTQIRKAIKEIHLGFNNLEVEELIPCNCSYCSLPDTDIIYYKLKELIRRIKRKRTTIECPNSYDNVSVRNLIINVINLEEINIQNRSRVFVSYAHENSEWLNKINVHLKPIVRDKKIELWSDKKILAGEKWKDEIQSALNNSSIAILLITAAFLASDFIHNNELPLLLKKAELGGTKIIPVIIGHSLFQETPNLAQFQSINSPDKPLNSLKESDQEKELLKLALLLKDMVN